MADHPRQFVAVADAHAAGRPIEVALHGSHGQLQPFGDLAKLHRRCGIGRVYHPERTATRSKNAERRDRLSCAAIAATREARASRG